MSQPQKLFIRFSTDADHDKLMDFYRRNPHGHVCDRQESLLRNLEDNGSVVLVENETGEIVGSSIAYPLDSQQDGVEGKWVEIGTTRIVMNGYPGLFNLMVGMQLLRTFLVEPPEESFVCQMKGKPVQEMARRLGFHPIVPTDELVAVSDRTLARDGEYSGTENWFAMGREGLPVVARLICDALDKPSLQHMKKPEESIAVDFSRSRFFQMFEPEIRDLASRDLGDPAQPDPKGRIAQARKAWMRGFFK